ncbi:hypothetical protein ACTNDG_04870 [Clostridium sp. HCP1S3_B4]|uniref:hypothetical protein n=1 Tax=unclassified Clostridium TaxID=2614128 RepID=UPI003F8CC5B3
MKKKNRILIAGLMAIAVTGASTLAYFTKSREITANTGDKNPLELKITNGNVEVTGVIGDGGETPNWSYDVARDSTEGYKDKLGQVGNIVAGITTTANRATDITSYENKHRSPDIEGLDASGKEDNVNNLSRWKIGTKVTGAISKARPGDAFVLGQAGKGGTGKEGLVITNSSNLTVKIKLEVNDDAVTKDPVNGDYVEVIKSLQDAGWKLYINDREIEDAKKTNIETALGESSFVLSPNEKNTIKIRLEFPLTQGDTYQNAVTGGDSISNFDIRNLFKIKATQENNPGWTTKDGTN